MSNSEKNIALTGVLRERLRPASAGLALASIGVHVLVLTTLVKSRNSSPEKIA